MHHHPTMKIGTYHQPLSTWKCCITPQRPMQAIAPASHQMSRPVEKKTAITMIEPRSSAMAKVSRKARTACGKPAPTMASTVKAKAMSVAIGMAQPAGCPSLANTLNSV